MRARTKLYKGKGGEGHQERQKERRDSIKGGRGGKTTTIGQSFLVFYARGKSCNENGRMWRKERKKRAMEGTKRGEFYLLLRMEKQEKKKSEGKKT